MSVLWSRYVSPARAQNRKPAPPHPLWLFPPNQRNQVFSTEGVGSTFAITVPVVEVVANGVHDNHTNGAINLGSDPRSYVGANSIDATNSAGGGMFSMQPLREMQRQLSWPLVRASVQRSTVRPTWPPQPSPSVHSPSSNSTSSPAKHREEEMDQQAHGDVPVKHTSIALANTEDENVKRENEEKEEEEEMATVEGGTNEVDWNGVEEGGRARILKRSDTCLPASWTRDGETKSDADLASAGAEERGGVRSCGGAFLEQRQQLGKADEKRDVKSVDEPPAEAQGACGVPRKPERKPEAVPTECRLLRANGKVKGDRDASQSECQGKERDTATLQEEQVFRLKILLAEDSIPNQKLMCRILQRAGHTVEAVKTTITMTVDF